MSTTPSAAPAVSRRHLLAGAALAATAASTLTARAADPAAPPQSPFTFCLNTSTIRGQKAGIAKEIELAAKAGYTAMEPWLNQFEAYVKDGGTLADLKKRFADNGISVVNVIAFAPWLMGGDDDGANQKNMDTMKRDMETVAQVGGLRIAASPAGAFKLENLDLKLAARRYRKVIEIGEQAGVGAMLEFWGPSKSLYSLPEALYIAAAAKHPKAMILCDVYHLHRGGSDYDALALVDGAKLPVMHFNDFPGDVPREKLEDKNRLMPGDGVAPLTQILSTLASVGARTALSLELFNADVWKMDVADAMKMGIDKMRAAVAKAAGNA
ncbi:MAG: sugar phosphate isomerase/epimerase family protein [Phycisphaerae bacterium]|nr:sugar phosphate isomerase/epimerase family protein [Tepidisphaeraceae bacterium]